LEEPITVRIFDTNEIERWFLKIENDLQTILENPTIELSFTQNGDQVLIIQKDKNISFPFDSLSSGFKAIFNIYANLLVRAQFQNIPPEDLSGITIIDEIDVHLHISLQKKVLPFLIKAFPKIQFIVSTHSPFVITSTDNDTIVYDISNGEFFEDDLSRYSYESVIKGLFHVNPISAETKELIQILKKLLNETPTNFVAIKSIIKKLIPLEENDKLDKKLRNLYLQAVNLLLDNDQLEDLDV
jgi:predicted ATP-binding protein involved in virulence